MKKPRIRKNRWGNWAGYIGTKKVIEFANKNPHGTASFGQELEARDWLAQQMGFPDADALDRFVESEYASLKSQALAGI